MRSSWRFLGVALVFLVLVSLGGCERLANFFGSITRRLEDISIENQAIEVGDIVDLEVTGLYSNETEEIMTSDLSWNTNDATVVTVSAGTVTGVAEGTAVVTVTYSGRNTFSDTAIITVAAAGTSDNIIYDAETNEPDAWLIVVDGVGSEMPFWDRSTDYAVSGSYSMKSVFTATGEPDAWGTGVQYTISSGPIDLSGTDGIAIQLQPNGVSGSVQLGLLDSDGTFFGTGAIAENAIPFGGSGWIRVAAPYVDMAVALWAPGTIAGFDLTSVAEFHIIFETGAGTVYVDDMSSY
jgi:hypothetical protein